ncbi:MAG TPA: NAD-dependent epimerase/dehydratase family protein [Patescibacteria group bacterium]|nr:NAD-dependent epimerase/dehydratase family protein [Patescibacteria group bacterium]
MKVLVTGGAGFIGSSLCERLLNEGNQVWVVDNLTTGHEYNLNKFRDNPNFVFKICGVETQEFLDFCASSKVKFDRVYDLACPTGVPNIDTMGDEMLIACSIGVWNVMKVAVESGADFLHTSSSEIYGEPLISPQAETYTGNVDPVGPRANYEEGKRFAETLIDRYVKIRGLRGRIVRLFNVYGPNMGLSDTRVIPRFAKQALMQLPLTVQGDGAQMRTLCYIDDILDGFELVISKGKIGEIYNLGSDQDITIRELAQKIISLIESRSEIISIPRPEHDHSSRMPVLNKINGLGWKQKINLEEGLNLTLSAFEARLSTMESINSNIQVEAKGI